MFAGTVPNRRMKYSIRHHCTLDSQANNVTLAMLRLRILSNLLLKDIFCFGGHLGQELVFQKRKSRKIG